MMEDKFEKNRPSGFREFFLNDKSPAMAKDQMNLWSRWAKNGAHKLNPDF